MPLGFNYEFAVGVRTHSASVELLQINMHTPKVKKVGRFFLTPLLSCKCKELVNLKAIQLSLALTPHINHLVNGSTFFYLLQTESDNSKSTDDQGSIAVEELEVSEVLL